MPPDISGATRILALIADPIIQARSPAMMTEILQARGRFGAFVFIPLEVPAGSLPELLAGLRRVGNFAGAIVSMPHKTAIVPLLDERTTEAEQVGAVNVIRRLPDGRLRGTNFDGEGFVAGLASAGHAVRGAHCLLAGAGGAASGIALALAAHGCASLAIVNRTHAKAEALAERVRAAFPAVAATAGDDGARRYDVAVNATSLGMRVEGTPLAPGFADTLPLSDDQIDRATLVAECVVAPETTALLARAAARRRAVHTGVPMLRAQMDLMLRFMGVE